MMMIKSGLTLPAPEADPEADPQFTGMEMYVGTMMAAALLAKGKS